MADNPELKELGGGWYQLPNGEKVQGEKEATKKLEEFNSNHAEETVEAQQEPEKPETLPEPQNVEYPEDNPNNEVPNTNTATTPNIQNKEKPPQKDYSGTNATKQGDDDGIDGVGGVDGDAGNDGGDIDA